MPKPATRNRLVQRMGTPDICNVCGEFLRMFDPRCPGCGGNVVMYQAFSDGAREELRFPAYSSATSATGLIICVGKWHWETETVHVSLRSPTGAVYEEPQMHMGQVIRFPDNECPEFVVIFSHLQMESAEYPSQTNYSSVGFLIIPQQSERRRRVVPPSKTDPPRTTADPTIHVADSVSDPPHSSPRRLGCAAMVLVAVWLTFGAIIGFHIIL